VLLSKLSEVSEEFVEFDELIRFLTSLKKAKFVVTMMAGLTEERVPDFIVPLYQSLRYNITSQILVFLERKSSNTKVTRRLAGIRLSANTKKPQRSQRKS
jgi:hypothetical protein